jgi:hypothetical protein
LNLNSRKIEPCFTASFDPNDTRDLIFALAINAPAIGGGLGAHLGRLGTSLRRRVETMNSLESALVPGLSRL